MHSARLSKSEETAAYSTFQNAVKHKKINKNFNILLHVAPWPKSSVHKSAEPTCKVYPLGGQNL